MSEVSLVLRSLCCLVFLSCGGDGTPADQSFAVNCGLPAISEEAVRPAGPHPAAGEAPAGYIQPGGRDILPVGKLLPIGGFPLSVRVLPPPYQRYVAVSNAGQGDNALVLIDPQAAADKAVVSTMPYPAGSYTPQSPALFYGLAVGQKQGIRVFVSGGGYDLGPADDPDPKKHAHVVDVYRVTGTPPSLIRDLPVRLPTGPQGLRYPAGLFLSADEKRLYIAGQADGSLTIANVDTLSADYGAQIGSIEGMGRYPYDVAVDEARGRAYVSLWGGQEGAGTLSHGHDGLVAVDVSDPRKPVRVSTPMLDLLLDTGRGSEQLLLSGSKLYVAAADADRVTALDLDTLALPQVADLSGPPRGLLGASPNALALDAERGRLYVANANDNALSVLSLPQLSPVGRLPTCAYPTGVAVLSDGTVLATCAKGIGSYPTDQVPKDGNLYEGTLQVIPRPSEQDLALGDRLVQKANGRPQAYQPTPVCPGAAADSRFPLPPQPGNPTPIKYVFLVVRENKTYDTLLGDLKGARGRADLTLFGEENTPNLHALARTFANLDNFYSNADASIQGHEWTTAALSNDFTEKAWFTTWGRASRPQSTFGGSEASEYPTEGGAGSLFQALDRAGVTYHNYGEIVNSAGAMTKFDSRYPGVLFNLDELDVNRADYIVSLLQDPTGTIEHFHYLLLPDDHTYGTRPGKPTPQSMVADNDEGLGRLIDGLSHSRYWPESVVFVIEDDPSDGADHVDQHRSICLAIGPWIRHGYVSSVNYDDPALWHTIGVLLGLKPVNGLVQKSAAMYDLFATQPDLSTYTAIPRKIPVKMNSAQAPMAGESMAIDFSRPDTAPLGRILWRAVRGVEPPFGKSRRDNDD